MRPIQHLPLPHPKDFDPGQKFFYDNFVKHFIADAIKIMDTGINIDQEAVENLRKEVDDILTKVEETLHKNPIINKFLELQRVDDQKEHNKKCLTAVRGIEYYLVTYKNKDITHRTWVINTYLKTIGKKPLDKWTVANLKQYNLLLKDSFLQSIVDGSVQEGNAYVNAGMYALAQYKLELWNRPRYEKAEEKVPLPRFNPGSSLQKQKLFEMLGVEATTKSKKTGDDSWSRDNLEILLKTASDKDLIQLLEAFIDHSFGAIIKNNFLSAFDRFTINGVLHGNLKIFGAKTFRPTSNEPNLLNMPSTKSVYAKPLKKCFKAPKGKVIYAIDLGALEDRGIANLTGDTNKKNVFLEGLDGHSLNACGYYPKEIKKIMGANGDNVKYVKQFKKLVDEGNSELDAIRSMSKGPTFKLAYGGYPDAHKGGVITQELFDNYHNVLYPGITEYRENYVLKTAKAQGYIHLGLGCRMYTSDAEQDIRTLHNGTVQFWSILTLIAVNEINYQKEQAGLDDAIDVCATIYDSIYFIVDEDAKTIKWLNDTIVPIICTQYLDPEPIRNVAEGEIGRNWADLHKVKNNASLEDVITVLKTVQEI